MKFLISYLAYNKAIIFKIKERSNFSGVVPFINRKWTFFITILTKVQLTVYFTMR